MRDRILFHQPEFYGLRHACHRRCMAPLLIPGGPDRLLTLDGDGARGR